MTTTTTNTAIIDTKDDLYTDKELKSSRDRAMEHMRHGPRLQAISRFILMIGGPILTAGVIGLIGIGGAAAAGGGIAIAATIIGAALTAIGMYTDYNSSRHYQSGYLDQVEVGAKSTARHLVQELKAQNISMNFEQNQRQDGMSWVQATSRGDMSLPQRANS